MRHLNFLIFLIITIFVGIIQFLIDAFQHGVPDAYENLECNLTLIPELFFYYNKNKRFPKGETKVFSEYIQELPFEEKKYFKSKEYSNKAIAFFSRGNQLMSLKKVSKVKNPYFIEKKN